MAICTSADVFEFTGSPADVQDTQEGAVTSLISQVSSYVESFIGRKIEPTEIVDVIIQDGLNSDILGNRIYLKGIYRDLYSVGEIQENGVTLTAVSGYNDGGDYYLDPAAGCLIRANRGWSLSQFGILISGHVGIGRGSISEGIKLLIIEIVASKSGLLKTEILTESGSIDTVRTLSETQIKNMLKTYVTREV